jgi:hypothetical protein
MARFSGDFRGVCAACGEYVEFAVGIDSGPPERAPIAVHFGPQGPVPIELREVNLVLMLDHNLDVKTQFCCPLCGQWAAGRLTCAQVGAPDASCND